MNDYSNNEIKNIYPLLPQGEKYRLFISHEILKKLQKEENHYETVRKKYNTFSNIFQNISVGSGSISVILSAVSVGTSLSGYGLIIGIPLGVLGGASGILSFSSGIYTKRLNKKVSKHERISATARSKINSIQYLISKGLSDGKLTEEEFTSIQQEGGKFEQMKMEIREKSKLKKKEIGKSEINLLIKNTVESFQKLGQSVSK